MRDFQKIALALVLAGAILLTIITLLQRPSTDPHFEPPTETSELEETQLKPLIVQAGSVESSEQEDLLPPVPPTPAEDTAPQASLSEQRVYERLQLQSRYFFRCYSRLLEIDPSLQGQVLIGFTINPTGKVAHAQISKSDFENDVFHRCILDVLERTPFQSFKGQPISTLFPLEFE